MCGARGASCRATAPAPPGAAPGAPAVLLGALPAALGWQERQRQAGLVLALF